MSLTSMAHRRLKKLIAVLVLTLIAIGAAAILIHFTGATI